jgi:DNA polymerase-1
MSDTPHVLIDRQDDLSMVVGAVEDTGLVGLDIETTGLKPRTDTARLLSLCCDTTDGTTMVYVVDLAAVDPTPLWELLKGRPIVGHNLAFDLAFLAKFGFEPADVRDTIIESRVLYTGDNTARKHSLADCCKRELNFDLDKTIQASDWSGPLTPQQIAYAALDADLARRLHIALDPKIEAAKLREVVDLENRDLPAMIWLAQSGIGFDRDAWSAVATESETEREQVRSDLDAAAPPKPQGEMFGPSWNWDSPADVKAALKAVGHEITTTSDDALAEIEHPLGGLIRQYRSAAKRVGTYGREWLKHVSADGRVYASWQQIGADSGRMACSKPNLQNLPRDVRYRRCFAASPGRALVKADYSQIELRLAAKIANEPTMIEAYRRGDDLHTLTASKILGKVDVTKDVRQLAKSLNFGLLYGMGAANLRVYCRSNYGVELTEQQAKEYRAAFFETYPGLARWQRTAGGSRDKAITTYTISGRHRLNVTRFSEKLNTPVQGSGADGLKAALALLWDRRGEHPTAFPVLVVHDEIVVECDHGEADSVSHWLKQAMIDGMDNFANPVPVEVEVSVASTWGGDRA